MLIWDPETGKCLENLKGHTNWINALTYLPLSPRGSTKPASGRLLSASGDQTIRVWTEAPPHVCDSQQPAGPKNTGTWSCERVLSGHSGLVNCLVVLNHERAASGYVWYSIFWVVQTIGGHNVMQ